MQLLKNGKLHRLNIFEGSVRSGKTYISMIMWAFWVAGSPKNRAYLMSGKTLTTLKRNVLEPLKTLIGDKFSYNIIKKEGELFGRKIYLEGAANVEAESKIRGMTLMGAYCDELTLFSEDFFVMLLSRLSENGFSPQLIPTAPITGLRGIISKIRTLICCRLNSRWKITFFFRNNMFSR